MAADLSRDLVTGRVARTNGQHQLVPDGCLDVLWIGDGSAWVCGSERRAGPSGCRPAPRPSACVSGRGRAGAVLGLDTADVRDRRAPLEDLLGFRPGRHLVEEVGDAGEPSSRVRVPESHVRRWLGAVQRDGVPDPLGLLAGQAGAAGDPAGGVDAGDLEPNLLGCVDGGEAERLSGRRALTVRELQLADITDPGVPRPELSAGVRIR